LRALKKILLATAFLLLGSVACGSGGNPVTAVLNKKPADVTIQQSEAKGLTKCSSSGSIDQMLASLKSSDPSSYTSTNQQWTKLKAAGATDAYFAIYAATKAFVLSFSEALWAECREYGVRVLGLCPGPTATHFQVAAGTAHRRSAEKMQTPEEVVEVILTPLETILRAETIQEEEWELRGQKAVVPFFFIQGHKVWGATAMMLSEFAALLKQQLLSEADSISDHTRFVEENDI